MMAITSMMPKRKRAFPLGTMFPIVYKYYTFLCEIPKGTSAKNEIKLDLEYNPIVQDRINDKARFYHEPIPWNYGCIPQTWEHPSGVDPLTGVCGDGDPIDVIEIGDRKFDIGDARHIRILGSLALIDQGETDWKIIAVDLNDPLSKSIETIFDIPDIVDSIRVWFRDYKIPDGKPRNEFALDGKPLDSDQTEEIVEISHEHWKDLFTTSQTGSH